MIENYLHLPGIDFYTTLILLINLSLVIFLIKGPKLATLMGIMFNTTLMIYFYQRGVPLYITEAYIVLIFIILATFTIISESKRKVILY